MIDSPQARAGIQRRGAANRTNFYENHGVALRRLFCDFAIFHDFTIFF
jgi:hypothetical protein